MTGELSDESLSTGVITTGSGTMSSTLFDLDCGIRSGLSFPLTGFMLLGPGSPLTNPCFKDFFSK